MTPEQVISKCAKQFEMDMSKAMKIAAKATVSIFKKNYKAAGIAVVTGELRDNIKVQKAEKDEIIIIDDAPYAVYVNDGTDKMAARPYFIENEELVKEIEKSIIKEVSKGF